MSAPQWITNSGSLGITKELEPFNYNLGIISGSFRANFSIVSGKLPPGLRLIKSDNTKGYPICRIVGAPLPVSEETIFIFNIRCSNELGQLADRTFSITVTGEDAPRPFVPSLPNQSLGEYFDGTWVDIDITAFDPDITDTLTYTLVGGTLPTGLSINNIAHIVGYVDPAVFAIGVVRFDVDLFDTNTFDQNQTDNVIIYTFAIRVSDGKIDVITNYKVTFYKGEVTLVDTSYYNSNQTVIVGQHVPVLLNRDTDIATVSDENFFYYQFLGKDFDDVNSTTNNLGYEILPVLPLPTIIGTTVNPIITLNSSIRINNIVIPLSDFPTVYTVATDITTAAAYNETLANVSAEASSGKLLIYIGDSSIVIENEVNFPLTDLGITPGTYQRNTSDPDGFVTANINKLLPASLKLNSSTGWLYGYIDPITTGEEKYIFYVRVYKKTSEPSNIVFEVDYGCELPFTIVNDSSQNKIDSLFLDARATDFTNKTIVLTKQEFFDPTYYGYETDPLNINLDGWYDPSGNIIHGWTLSSVIPNYRAGIWRIVKSVVRQNAVSLPYGTVIEMKSMDTIAVGMPVSGVGIDADTIVVSVDIPNKFVFISKPTIANIPISSDLTFGGTNYYLDFVQPIPQGCLIFVDKFTGYGSSQYQERKVKLLYESLTSFGSTGPETPVMVSTSAINSVIVESTRGIDIGYTIVGVDIVGTPTVLAIDRTSKQITMSSVQSLVATEILTFLSPQTVPHYTRNVDNPFSSLWKRILTVTNSNNYLITWITQPDLGVVTSGVPSTLSVHATNSSDTEISYSIIPYIEHTMLSSAINQNIIQLDSVDGILVGMPVISTQVDIPLSTVVVSVDEVNNIIKLSSLQTLPNNTVLRFTSDDLPRGLEFTNFGNFEGRASHQHLLLNDGTTFDKDITTFDRKYVVSVRASLHLNDPIRREIYKDRSFTFYIADYKRKPSSNLYLEFLLNGVDRDKIRTAIFNDKIVPDEHIYRLSDHWFGRQNTYRMLVAYGINTATDSDLIGAIAAYHHTKQYLFTDLRWAQSLTSTGEVEYEVIYINPVDRFTTENGTQLSGSISTSQINIPITADNSYITADDDLTYVSDSKIMELYPASLPNMREQIKNKLSRNTKRLLANWLIDQDGKCIDAVPLLYVKPGFGKKILYKLQLSLQLTNINAITDRYLWDDGLALNFDKSLNQYYLNKLTTFDQIISVENIVSIVDFAVETPFYQINNANAYDLGALGLIDGYRGDLNNKLLVFFKQELYTNPDGSPIDFNMSDELYDGWVRVTPYEEQIYGENYEPFTVIPGFQEHFINPTIDYQRAGIWRILIGSNGIVTLDFVSPLQYINSSPYTSVGVTSGVKHGGTVVSLVAPETLGSAYTVPGFIDKEIVSAELKTTFDDNTTKFFSNSTDEYLKKDVGSKYTVFKRKYFIESGIVSV